jgi:hypothetical protein
MHENLCQGQTTKPKCVSSSKMSNRNVSRRKKKKQQQEKEEKIQHPDRKAAKAT